MELLRAKAGYADPSAGGDEDGVPAWPRICVIDHTSIGDGTATGELKANLFGTRGASLALQLNSIVEKKDAVLLQWPDGTSIESPTEEKISAVLRQFQPELILYRPVPNNDALHALAMQIITRAKLPHVIWLMDDWLERLRHDEPMRFARYESDVALLLQSAGACLSISDEMSREMSARYDCNFVAVANGIDEVDWPDLLDSRRRRPTDRLLIRYAGGLAPDMSLQAVLDLANCVGIVSAHADIRLEIETNPTWHSTYGKLFSSIPNVTIRASSLDSVSYKKWLQAADVNVVAYNCDEFDHPLPERFSLSNKLPECLASGAPLLAIGPSDLNTLARCDLMPFVYRTRGPQTRALRDMLRHLCRSPEERLARGSAGRRYALENFSLDVQRHRLAKVLRSVSGAQLLRGNSDESETAPFGAEAIRSEEPQEPLVSFKKITVVMPNLNGGDFLEPAILSVISQNYPNLEFIISDGGSTDQSMELVRKYGAHFTHVIHEPDEGHANALNKGFALSSGEIMGWINSDDLLMPGSLFTLNRVFQALPDVEWLTGRKVMLREDGSVYQIGDPRPWSWLRFMSGDYRYIQQESTYWRRSLWQRAGANINENLRLAVDLELWLRFFESAKLYSIDTTIGAFRKRQGQRSATQRDAYERECRDVLEPAFAAIPDSLRRRFSSLRGTKYQLLDSYDFQKLPEELAAEDPPILIYSAKKEEFAKGYERSSLQEGREVHVVLRFDGMHFYDFSSSQSFDELRVSRLSLCLEPMFPWPYAKADAYSAFYPATVLIAGPISIQQPDEDIIEIVIKGARFNHWSVRLPRRVRSLELTVEIRGRGIKIVANSETIAETEIDGDVVNILPRLRVGCGHNDRFWVGGIAGLEFEFTDSLGGSSAWRPLDDENLRKADVRLRKPPELRLGEPPIFRRLQTPLSQFRNRHVGKRCFVMGSGPSLKKMDLSVLENETVFACNASFLLFDKINWRPKYYTCVDSRVLSDRGPEIAGMLRSNENMIAFFPAEIVEHGGEKRRLDTKGVVGFGPRTYFFNEVFSSDKYLPFSMFSLDIDSHVVMPYTVTVTMLQLAVYMGFKEIYLIGCDTSYVVPPTVIQEGEERGGVKLELTSTADDDPNHFDPRYFGAGRKWHNPQVDGMIRHYEFVREVAEEIGVDIFNATVGGMLEVFPRKAFDELFPGGIQAPWRSDRSSAAEAGEAITALDAPSETRDHRIKSSSSELALTPVRRPTTTSTLLLDESRTGDVEHAILQSTNGMAPIVDFCIIGFPNCGTAELAVFMRQVSAFHLLAPDSPEESDPSAHRPETKVGFAREDYINNIPTLKDLYARNPQILFIVCYRDPSQSLLSLYELHRRVAAEDRGNGDPTHWNEETRRFFLEASVEQYFDRVGRSELNYAAPLVEIRRELPDAKLLLIDYNLMMQEPKYPIVRIARLLEKEVHYQQIDHLKGEHSKPSIPAEPVPLRLQLELASFTENLANFLYAISAEYRLP